MEIGKPIETIEVTDPGIEQPAHEPTEIPDPVTTPVETPVETPA